MKRIKTVRNISAIMLVIIFLLQMAGCNNNTKVEKTVLDHVYRQTEIDIPEGIDNVNSLTSNNGHIIVVGSRYSEETMMYENVLFTVNEDGTDPVEKVIDPKITGYDGYNLSYMTVRKDGKIMAIAEVWKSDPITYEYTSDSYLLILSETGEVIDKYNLKTALIGYIDTEYFYVNGLISDDLGNIYLASNESIFVLNSEFRYQFQIDFEENTWMEKMFMLGDGRAAVAMQMNDTDGSKTKVMTINLPLKGFDKEIEVNDQLKSNIYNVFLGAGYSLYYNNDVAVYGYSLETNSSTEVLNWINSDIENTNVSCMTAISEKKFVGISYEYDYLTYNSSLKLVTFNYIPPEEVVPKYTITLATIYTSYELRKAVIMFNRNSEEYRIQVKDYASNQDAVEYNDIISKLNNDIIAGNIPDILISTTEMPFDSYAAKGLFYDLNKLMEKDEFNRDEYFANIFDALSVEGKMYSIIPSFSVRTVAAKTKFVGDKFAWSFDDMNALMQTLPSGTLTFFGMNRKEIMDMAMSFTMGQFINTDTGECSFNSVDFVKLLEFCNTFDEKSIYETIDWENVPDDFWTDIEKAYEEDRVILSQTYLNSFYQCTELRNYTFKDDVSLIGFPTKSESGSVIIPSSRISILAKSKLVDGSWEFIKYFLSEEYQDSISNEWPVRISSYDKLGEAAIKGDTGGIIGIRDGYIKPGYDTSGITTEDVQYIKELLSSVDSLIKYDTGVTEIINDEIDMYFAGIKTAQETANIIQSRIQIYISEGM
ncbi:MAG: extracellular solute-binding protein [Clostridia bacterium]